MALSRQRQREIMREDAKRRNARNEQEITDFMRAKGHIETPTGVDPYHYSRAIKGVPANQHRIVRASDNCWKRGMRGRTVGVANPTDTIPTVRVIHADGTTAIVPASNFHKSRTTRNRQRTVQQNTQPEVLRMAEVVGYIGNVE